MRWSLTTSLLLLLFEQKRLLCSENNNDYDYDSPLAKPSDSSEEENEGTEELCMHCKCYLESDDSIFLDCSSLDIDTLPDWLRDLVNNTNNIYLDLSYNAINKLDSFYEINAWNIDLSNNNLESIGASAFQYLSSSLLQLDLSSNKLDAVGLQQDCFKGAVLNETENYAPFRVIDLSLANNRIHTVRADLFAHMNQLTDLNLSDNPLSPLTTEMIRAVNSIKTLESLSLRNCGLLELSGELLGGLEDLVYLDLAGNRFKQVDVSLKVIPSLETLILDDNLIQRLTEESFSHLDSLRNLSVSNMESLLSVEANTFADLANLNLLRMSNNKQLEWISPDAWPSSKDQALVLQELDLSNNHLRYLPSVLLNDFQDWNSISIINLQGNPFWCDCHNEWLITTLVPIIMKKNPQLTQNLLCGGPAKTAFIKEELAVIGQLTKPQDLPCQDKQFDPWQRNYNLPDASNPVKRRPRRKTLPLALTIVCVVVVMGTFGMVGLLYLQKARRDGYRIRRVRHRDESGPGARVGYIPARKQVPSGQPGLRSGHATSPATEANHPEGQPGSSARRPENGENSDGGGVFNLEFKDDEDFDGPIDDTETRVNSAINNNPFRRPPLGP